MACDNCDWADAESRAHAVAEALPEWKTRSADFFESVASTIAEKRHVTERQLEVIEKGEGEV